jgi:hypothetical protein
MITPKGFISRDRLVALMEQLDQAIRSHALITLAGSAASGKTSLLDFWIRQGSKAIRPAETAFVKLKPEVGKSLPMSCILVSRLWYALNQIERPAYTRNRVPDGDDITIDIIGKFSYKCKYIYAFRFRTHLLTEIMEATRNDEYSIFNSYACIPKNILHNATSLHASKNMLNNDS